jgi:hypothetical protein
VEVGAPVFVRTKGISLSIDLHPVEAQRLTKIARSKGVKETSVVRQWVVERLRQSKARRGEPGVVSRIHFAHAALGGDFVGPRRSPATRGIGRVQPIITNREVGPSSVTLTGRRSVSLKRQHYQALVRRKA